MTLIIAGSVRVPSENPVRFRPLMKAMLEASRAERDEAPQPHLCRTGGEAREPWSARLGTEPAQ